MAALRWRSMMRATVRVRLAALLFALVVIAGALVLALTGTLLVRHVRANAPAGFTVATIRAPGGQTIRIPLPGPPPGARLNGPLTVRSLPRSVPALLRFRSAVETQTLSALSGESALALGIMAILAAAVAWVVAGRVLRPLQAITAAARHLSYATLHERIRMDGPQDEIRDLADTFDDMLARLEKAFRSQRNFLANASHELRTPLAVQRTLIDVALADPEATASDLRSALSSVSESLDEEGRLIEGLMVLATSERGLGRRERVDLLAVVEHAVAMARADAIARAVEVRAVLAPAAVDGDAALVSRMVANLLENAVRYNRPGGWVDVAMESGAQRVRVIVRNTGPKVPAEAVEALFEPFRRLGSERTGEGAGLGLSIARAIAAAHGGTLQATVREEGGLAVTADLPLADAYAPPSRP